MCSSNARRCGSVFLHAALLFVGLCTVKHHTKQRVDSLPLQFYTICVKFLSVGKKKSKGFSLTRPFYHSCHRKHGIKPPVGQGSPQCFVSVFQLMLAAQKIFQTKRRQFIKVTGIEQVTNSLVISQTQKVVVLFHGRPEV